MLILLTFGAENKFGVRRYLAETARVMPIPARYTTGNINIEFNGHTPFGLLFYKKRKGHLVKAATIDGSTDDTHKCDILQI